MNKQGNPSEPTRAFQVQDVSFRKAQEGYKSWVCDSSMPAKKTKNIYPKWWCKMVMNAMVQSEKKNKKKTPNT